LPKKQRYAIAEAAGRTWPGEAVTQHCERVQRTDECGYAINRWRDCCQVCSLQSFAWSLLARCTSVLSTWLFKCTRHIILVSLFAIVQNVANSHLWRMQDFAMRVQIVPLSLYVPLPPSRPLLSPVFIPLNSARIESGEAL